MSGHHSSPTSEAPNRGPPVEAGPSHRGANRGIMPRSPDQLTRSNESRGAPRRMPAGLTHCR